MPQVRVSKAARADLISIRAYITDELCNPDAAAHVLSELKESLINSEITHRAPFPPSETCKNLEIAPLFLRFPQDHLTKNSLLCMPPHLISASLILTYPHNRNAK